MRRVLSSLILVFVVSSCKERQAPSGGSPDSSASRTALEVAAPLQTDSVPNGSVATVDSVGEAHRFPQDPLAASFLRDLGRRTSRIADSLQREFHRIRAVADPTLREALVDSLALHWSSAGSPALEEMLTDSRFQSRIWIDSIHSSDTVFERQVRDSLRKAGLFLDYSEGYCIGGDLGGRPDLLALTSGPVQRERYQLDHQETFTLVYNDAGIVCPIDTLVGRIVGWEDFAARHPRTSEAEDALRRAGGYLSSLLGGATNTPSFGFEFGPPDPEFAKAWKHHSQIAKGPSRKMMGEWLALLKAEKNRPTAKVRAWLQAHDIPCEGSLGNQGGAGEE